MKLVHNLKKKKKTNLTLVSRFCKNLYTTKARLVYKILNTKPTLVLSSHICKHDWILLGLVFMECSDLTLSYAAPPLEIVWPFSPDWSSMKWLE
jgi:hypothetical protein